MNRTIRSRFEREMKRHNMTRAQLAVAAGVPPSEVTRFFKPDSNPTLRTVEKFAKALGMDWTGERDFEALYADLMREEDDKECAIAARDQFADLALQLVDLIEREYIVWPSGYGLDTYVRLKGTVQKLTGTSPAGQAALARGIVPRSVADR